MKTPNLLIIGDSGLREEIEQALPGASASRIVVYHAADFRAGVEIAGIREPEIVCADFGNHLPTLWSRTRELAEASPASFLTAVYDREGFGSGDEESAFLIGAVRGRIDDFVRRPVASSDLRKILERFVGVSPSSSVGAVEAGGDRLAERRRFDRQVPSRYRRRRSDRPGLVVSFISNKGGVGKSTLATNLACALARKYPDDVLLVDASLQLGVCRALLDLDPSAGIVDAIRERERLDAPLLQRLAARHHSGLRLLAAPVDAMEAVEVEDDSLTRVLNLARRTFRFVVVDTFPLLDSTVMTILDVCDLAYVVLQGTVPDVIGTAGLLGVLDRLGVSGERRRLILNRTYPRHIGRLRRVDVEERLGMPVAYEFPYRKGLLVAQNAGEPYALGASSRFGYDPVLRALAAEMEAAGESAAEAEK